MAVAGAALLVLAGCTAVETYLRTEAWQDLERSKAAYKECVQNHPADTSACGALREAFEADLKVVRALGGKTVTIEEE